LSNKSDCKTIMDINFKDVITGLNELRVNYWVCNGTLLGIVREGDLIPWDHDIDIACWANKVVPQEIINKLSSIGFQLVNDGGGYDFLEFERPGGRKVDFNFFRPSLNGLAFSEWCIPRNKLSSVVIAFGHPAEYRGRYQKLISQMIFLSAIPRLIQKLLAKLGYLYKSAGYTIPMTFLEEFESIDCMGLSVRVPARRHEVLEFIYGNGWRVPAKNYNWILHSDATRISKQRFKI
jgi:phosphorylcholine metabolism protein LicD